jgi:hypothetical protein
VQQICDRVAGLDVHRDNVVTSVGSPGGGGTE